MLVLSGAERISALREAGVPDSVISFFDNCGSVESVEFIFAPASGFEGVLRSSEWPSLVNCRVAVLCQGGNGDTAHCLRCDERSSSFIHFGLEEEIMTDYGSDIARLVADQIIRVYEDGEIDEPEGLVELGLSMGFRRSRELIDALEAANVAGARASFESDRAWRDKYLPDICDGVFG